MRSTFVPNRLSGKRLVPVVMLALLLVLNAIVPQVTQAAGPTTFNGGGMNAGGQTSGPLIGSPSEINVSMPGTVTDVTVTLSGVTSNRPDDFDILLVGPTGVAVLLMSDACGSQNMDGVNLTFADGFPSLPNTTSADSGPCQSGTYGPSNYTGGADHPHDDRPGNITPTDSLLSGFIGTDPNGTWALHVLDDESGSGANKAISSWSITITTEDPPVNQPPTIDPIGDVTLTEGQNTTVQVSATDPEDDVLNYGVSSSDDNIAQVTIDDEGIIDVDAVGPGTAIITVSVDDGTNDPVTTTFNVIVNEAPPSIPLINPIADQSMIVGETRTLPIDASDPDNDPLTYDGGSSDESVVVATVSGPSVTLNAVAVGTATVTVAVDDGQGNQTSETFNVTVTEQPVDPTQPPSTPVPQPTQDPNVVIYTEEDHRRAQAPLCMDLSGQTSPAVRAAVPDGAVPGGNVYCRVLAQDGVFPNPIDSARVGDPGLIEYGIITAVDVFGVTSNGFADPTFEHAVTVCLQGTGRFIFLSALNSPRTTYEPPSFVQDGYTCAAISSAGTVVLIPPAPQN